MTASLGFRARTEKAAGVTRLAMALLLALFGAGILTASPANAAGSTEGPPEPPPEASQAEPSPAETPPGMLGPEVPRGAVADYLDACRAGRYAQAAERLDLSGVPEAERAAAGPVLARRLKVVLDRELWINLETLSTQVQGHRDDGLPESVDRVGVVQTAKGAMEILIRRDDAEAGARRTWRFAPSTVQSIPELYAEFGYGPLGELLPREFFELSFLEIELWQWLGLLLLAAGAYTGASLITSVLRRIVSPLVKKTRTELDDHLIRLLTAPVRVSFALLLAWLGLFALRLKVPAHEFIGGLIRGLAVVAGTWILMRVAHVFSDLSQEHLERQGQRSVVAVVPLARKTVKVVLVGMAAIGLLQSLGFNVTGIIAGLGVGGLAVALAAQKTVENLFGGVTLTTDQPVRVGEFCRFGDKVGTVEEIGLRSTRIRTLDRTIITVPNAEFSQVQIENFAARDRIRLFAILGLRYETTPDQLRHVLVGLRRLLASHPAVDPEPARVRFVGFGAHSLDLEVFAYCRTSDWNEFLKMREDLYLRMMDVVAESGTGFAFPSQTLYLGRDDGVDRGRAEEAEKTVRAWRDEGKLPFPDFSPEMVAELRNRLDYPPEGSISVPST